ncbi:MAG: esterase-like activity of phytase family protein [Myxococcota bacterium]
MSTTIYTTVLSLIFLSLPNLGEAASGDNRLIGFSSLPSDSFAPGPLSGQDNGSGEFISANGREGPFPGQPIQGFSGVQFAPGASDVFWFLSDNGFGGQSNSADYLLRIYQARPGFTRNRIRRNVSAFLDLFPTDIQRDSGGVAIDTFISLRDPLRLISFPIQRERSPRRLLTGADFDIESFVIGAYEDIWVGDEFGPFLLHFGPNGRLIEAPIETPNVVNGELDFSSTVQSPQNPFLTNPDEANLSGSRGFEGMAFSPDRSILYPVLEGTVDGDPEGAVRIYEFDANASEYTGFVGFYQLDQPNHAIGDITPVNENEFLIIERDGGQAESAEFKKIFLIDFSEVDEDGFVAKRELVDLLLILDPRDLNRDGSRIYSMPFVTIEDVLVIDRRTILVANDNNYPFSVGRPPEIDNNEVVLIRLAERLDLDPALGVQH